MKSKILFFLCFGLMVFGLNPKAGWGQELLDARIQVSGLTCSQCSRSVEMEIRKLPFIKDVNMDLEGTETVVYFKKDQKVDLLALAQAVRNAGFSTKTLMVDFSFADAVSSKGCFTYQNNSFSLLTNEFSKDLKRRFQLIGQPYMSKKDFKKTVVQGVQKCSVKGQNYILRPVKG